MPLPSSTSDLMNGVPARVTPNTPLRRCLERLSSESTRQLLVTDTDRRLLGVLHDHDVFSALRLRPGDNPDALTAGDRMRPGVTRAMDPSPAGPLAAMLHKDCDVVVLVNEQGAPVGVITEHAMVKAAAELPPGGALRHHEGRTACVLPQHTRARVAWAQMCEERLRHLVLVDALGRLSGVLSFADLALVSDERSSLGQLRSNSHPVSVQGRASVQEAAQVMLSQQVGCLPVVDAGNKPTQLITRRDLLGAVVAALEDELLFPESGYSSRPWG